MISSTADNTIDVRTLVPRERHAAILAALRELATGQALEIVNDHDPKPLRHRLEAEAPGRYSWSYLENGPEVWRVSIGKPVRSHASGGCCGVCGGAA
ncbi:MAG: DUF2249 domain-containing protein [Burkholderiaceae bacterium]|nr:DUF2249 domain-containing protein [Burkholderiaceae bacterium]